MKKDAKIIIGVAAVLLFLLLVSPGQKQDIGVEYYKDGERVYRGSLFTAAFIKYDQVRFNIYADNTGGVDITSWEVTGGSPSIFVNAFPTTSGTNLMVGEENKIVMSSDLINASDLAAMSQPVNFNLQIKANYDDGSSDTREANLQLEFAESVGGGGGFSINKIWLTDNDISAPYSSCSWTHIWSSRNFSVGSDYSEFKEVYYNISANTNKEYTGWYLQINSLDTNDYYRWNIGYDRIDKATRREIQSIIGKSKRYNLALYTKADANCYGGKSTNVDYINVEIVYFGPGEGGGEAKFYNEDSSFYGCNDWCNKDYTSWTDIPNNGWNITGMDFIEGYNVELDIGTPTGCSGESGRVRLLINGEVIDSVSNYCYDCWNTKNFKSTIYPIDSRGEDTIKLQMKSEANGCIKIRNIKTEILYNGDSALNKDPIQ